LAAEADFGIFLCPDDSGTAFAQRRKHFLDIVPDGGHDPHSGYRYSSHANSFPPSGGILPEQAYPQIACLVYGFSVSLQPSVADPQHQPAPHDALEIDAIFDQPSFWRDHAGELDFARGDRPALAWLAKPAKKEPRHLPQRIEAEATGHDRIADEVAGKEPEVRMDIELGPDEALTELPALFAHLGYPVEHQHGRRRKLRIAGAE